MHLCLLVPLLFLVVGGLAVAASGLFGWISASWARAAVFHRHTRREVIDGPGWWARVKAWGREARAMLTVAAWKAEAGPALLEPAEVFGDPVLCVHGFTQDGTNFAALRNALWARGRPSAAVSLGLPGRHPRRYVPKLVRALEDLVARYPDLGVDIVAHSMGGVLLRQTLGDRPDLAAHVSTVVTLGSPHHGTQGARGFVRYMPEGGGLHPLSPWLNSLPTFSEAAPNARSVTIAGTADYVVYPIEVCHLEGSASLDLEGIGHAGLLADPRAIQAVLDVLDGVLPARPEVAP